MTSSVRSLFVIFGLLCTTTVRASLPGPDDWGTSVLTLATATSSPFCRWLEQLAARSPPARTYVFQLSKGVCSRLCGCTVFDGSYLEGLVELISGWRVSDLSSSPLHPSRLLSEIDSGEIFDGDFLSAIERQFEDNFEFTMDRVTGLFEGEQSELSDFLRSPVDKFEEHFGLSEKCSGPGFICGEKIPDTCTGPSYSFVIDGGVCVIDEDSGEVVCSRPSVSIIKIPATCNLKYDSSTTVLGYSCVEKREFGETKTKTLGKKGRKLDLEAGEPFQFFDLEDLPYDLSVFFD